MKPLLIRGATLVLPDRLETEGDLLIREGKIAAVGKGLSCEDGEVLEARGKYLFPGFIDVHIHGGGGADFMDATPEAFETAARAHLMRGTTSLVPTAMTAPTEELEDFIRAYHAFRKESPLGKMAKGMHLEGPYFSNSNAKSAGAQNGNLIRPFDFEEIERLISLGEGEILRWDAAPENKNSDLFAKRMAEAGILCSAGHSDATGEEAKAGFDAGFSHETHFYNAVTAYKKRDQVVTSGVVEAAYLDDSVSVELICDGKHIPRLCLLLALKIKGVERVMGITDATRLSCTEEKEGMLGSLKRGTRVIVEDGVAKLPDRISYAGSICTMDRALRVLCLSYGLDPVTAARMLSTTPAAHIGRSAELGSLEAGKIADLVLTDEQFQVERVFLEGEPAERYAL